MTPLNSLPDPACVLKVDDGHGFVVEYRRKLPTLPKNMRNIWVAGKLTRPLSFLTEHVVVTAAHCLPHMPPADGAAFAEERTYTNLLGKLNCEECDVLTECLFVDPVADVAVLGAPDEEELNYKSGPTTRLPTMFQH
jgi:hypothetical protein